MAKNKLDELAAKHLEAKHNENEWRKARVAIEGEILQVVGCKDEGTTSIDTDEHRVKTTGKVTCSITKDEATKLQAEIDRGSYARLIVWKPTLLKKELDWLEENAPEVFRVVQERITEKPAKPSVSVEVLG